jgi:hypothetical protein
MDAVLKELMTDDEHLSLQEISDRIYETKRVRMRPSTIGNLLNHYIEKYGEPPLEKINHQIYKLSQKFYDIGDYHL